MKYDPKVIQALDKLFNVFSDIEKKRLYEISQTMTKDLYDIFLKVLATKSAGDVKERKRELMEYIKRRKKEVDEYIKTGKQNIYKEAEKASLNLDNKKEDDLIDKLNMLD